MTAKAKLALVIDDSQDQLDLLQRLLEREGFNVFTAINAETAIAAFEDVTPALAVIDLQLPGVTGFEITERIRHRFAHCKIIVSSVLDVSDYPEADAALPKPVTRATLHAALVKVEA